MTKEQDELGQWHATFSNRTPEQVHALLVARDREALKFGEALKKIAAYPVHSEPVGGAMAMQDIAIAALVENRIELEVVHLAPAEGSPRTTCCWVPVLELPQNHRMTDDVRMVTCKAFSAQYSR